MNRRSLMAVGAVACLGSLALILVEPRGALCGWLVGFTFWSSVPLGALGWLMMMKVIPGPWREELAPWAERLLLFLPLAALAVLPILLGERELYGWARLPLHGYRAIYLSMWAFPLRSALFLVGAGVLALLLLTRPTLGVPLSSGGLIAFVLFDTTVVIDWLMSLEPDFHSSGFGLYGLSIQMMIALCVLVLLRLGVGDAGENNGVLGGLLITALLTCIYLAFMQFFITWSDNLRDGVRWYEERGQGLWTAILYVAAACHLVSLFLLFFSPIRQGRRWLMGLSFVILLGKALEVAWLVLPVAPNLAVGLGSAALAFAGIFLLAVTLPPPPLARRHAMST